MTTKEILKDVMSKHKVKISYRKRNGQNRIFYATRNLKAIPKVDRPTGGKMEDGDNNVKFYSYLDDGWRCVIPDRVRSVQLVLED